MDKDSIVQYNAGLVAGSMQDIAQRTGQPLANTWMNVEVVVLCDCSGSMDLRDGRDGTTRWESMIHELGMLQNNNPGKIAVISFDSDVEWHPSGKPHPPRGSTDVVAALEFVQAVDGTGIQFFLISDGYPDDPVKAIKIARRFKSKIHTIYVGPESDTSGIRFLMDLSAVTGGSATTDFALKQKALTENVTRLLTAG